MSDALRRAIRSFLQAFLGSFIGSGVLSAFEADGIVDWTVLTKAGTAAIIAGIISVLVFAQNWLEDNTNFPALLKAPASEGENPVPNDAGQSNLQVVLIVLVIVVLILWAIGVIPPD